MTPTEVGGGATGPKRTRTFAEIIAEDLQNRNILEIFLVKIPELRDGAMVPPKPLQVEDLGELIFDVIKLEPQSCLGVDLFTGRYDTKEIKLKPNVDPTPYLTLESPITFKSHDVIVRKQRCNITRVTFKNVPFVVPDEEILHLCIHYGKPVSNVIYEKMFNKAIRGCMGATRYVDMELDPGKQFEHY